MLRRDQAAQALWGTTAVLDIDGRGGELAYEPRATIPRLVRWWRIIVPDLEDEGNVTSDPGFDPYEVLQVARFADSNVIRAAHKARIAAVHPDVAPGDAGRAALAAQINAARDLLLSPSLRAGYDARHPAAGRPYAGMSTTASAATGSTVARQPAAPTPAPPQQRVTVPRFLGYLAWCAVSVGLAQVGGILIGLIATFTNLAGFVGAMLGPDVADWLVRLVGNLAFAMIFGYLVGEGVRWLLVRADESAIRIASVIAGILGFVFPVISAGTLYFLHGLAPDVVETINASDVNRLVTVVAMYALVAGLAALGIAALVRPEGRRAGS